MPYPMTKKESGIHSRCRDWRWGHLAQENKKGHVQPGLTGTRFNRATTTPSRISSMEVLETV